MELLKRFLTYDPKRRLSCEDALKSDFFLEEPRAIDPKMFPTWPAKSELGPGGAQGRKQLPILDKLRWSTLLIS
jgi:hypothetical protein